MWRVFARTKGVEGNVGEQRIREVVAKCAAKNFVRRSEADIKDSDDFIYDLGGDSLDVVEFFMLVENVFDVRIPGETEAKMHKVGDVVDFLVKMNAEKPLAIDKSHLD